MKKYFVFENYDDIIITDLKEIITDENIVISDKKGNKKYIYKLVLGNFFKVIYAAKSRKDNNDLRKYEVNPDGNGIIISGRDYEDNITKEIKTEYVTVSSNGKLNDNFIEFPDDESAELWAEAVRSDYVERYTNN